VLLVRTGRRRLSLVLGLAVLIPWLLALGTHLPTYEPFWHVFPPLRFPRVPERLLPIACLALAALAAVAVARLRHPALVAALVLLLALDLRVSVFQAVDADEANAAYAALEGPGPLLELPVFRPGQHWGSVYLGYARQSPRERPQGYSTVAGREADRWAASNRGLSCGRGEIPAWVRYVALHRGLYPQSRMFGPDCPARAEEMLRAGGWRLLRRDGAIATYERR
jgi:hypothetical protein